MDILKTSTDWARTEILSTSLFIVFGVVFIAASIGFWQLGKTDLAKAYVIPLAIAGALLTIIGLGLSYTNYKRVPEFQLAYDENKAEFVKSEIDRAEATLKEYDTIVFTAIPLIIVACGLGLLFLSSPYWRAGLITTLAMLAIILSIDGTAQSRIQIYYELLMETRERQKED